MGCGGSPPLFAARACPGVLQPRARSKTRRGKPRRRGSGSKLPHSTCDGGVDHQSPITNHSIFLKIP